LAQTVGAVLSVGECFVARVRTGFLVGINIAVDAQLAVSESYQIAQRVEEAVRNANPKIRHIFVQVMPHESF
jgi:divalent metal cation (Fe/Co/Zn/Cd) transporter